MSKISQQALNADLNGSLNILRKFFQNNLEIDEPIFWKESIFTPIIHKIKVA